MIRVGPSLFTANLNEFHSQSPQESGFYTNVADSSPPSQEFNHLASDNTAFNVVDSNILIGSFLNVGDTVSDVYITITKVGGGFTAIRSNGFGATVAFVIPRSVTSGSRPALVLGELTYIRFDNLTPDAIPKNYSYYSGASGSSPRDIVVVNTAFANFNTTSKQINGVGTTGTFDLLLLTISSSGCQFSMQRDLNVFTCANPSYSGWSGSSIGGTEGGYRLVCALDPSG